MKKQIRKEILAIRKALSSQAIRKKSAQITTAVLKESLITSGQTLIYMDFRNEVTTRELIEYCIAHYGFVLLPRVKGDHLTIHKITKQSDFILSSYGILEPKSTTTEVPISTIDLILAPGVAFDKEGYRLGYGGGYYDRLLSQKRKEVLVVALAFECQLIAKVPTEPHDYKMDLIITENQIIRP